MSSSREVHILLAGDRGVGKTSLLMALMRERFCSEVCLAVPVCFSGFAVCFGDALNYVFIPS